MSDIANFGDWRRFRAWLLAVAVAMIGVLWIERSGIADMSASLYVTSQLMWGGHILGGLIFGIGMVFFQAGVFRRTWCGRGRVICAR